MRVNIWPVNSSVMTYVLPLRTEAEALLVVPEPELDNPNKVMVTAGTAPAGEFVESPNVRSGSTRHTKAKLCPSPMSNSDEEIKEFKAIGVPSALSFKPFMLNNIARITRLICSS